MPQDGKTLLSATMMSLGHSLSQRHAKLCERGKSIKSSGDDAAGRTSRIALYRQASGGVDSSCSCLTSPSPTLFFVAQTQELASLEHHRAQADEAAKLADEIKMLKDRLVACREVEAKVGRQQRRRLLWAMRL